MSEMDKNKWARKFPDLGTGPISVEPLISQEMFERERDEVFRKVWLKLGRVEEIPKVGDLKVKRVEIANTSVIMVRGKDNKIRAFHNACSHRTNKVVSEVGEETFGSSRAAVMACRFHGWVYDANGHLVDIPQEDRFLTCIDREKDGLSPIHCDIWNGFIFVNFAPTPRQSLKDFLGDYASHFDEFQFEAHPHCFTYMTELNCNWKIGLDAFAEAYHVPTIHSGTFPGVAAIEFDDIRLLGDHRTGGLHVKFGQPPSPAAALAQKLARASLGEVVSHAEQLPPTINPGRQDSFVFELSVMFPNFLIHVTEGFWFTHQFWPLSKDRTLWEGKYYVSKPETYSMLWGIEHSQILQRNAWLEDTATMEATHEAAESGAKDRMLLQDEEVLLRHGYHVLEKYTGIPMEAK